jgi:hypothetical protein
VNGVRITLIDLGAGQVKQSRLLWIWSIGVGALIFLAGAIPLFLSSVLGR